MKPSEYGNAKYYFTMGFKLSGSLNLVFATLEELD